MARRTRPAIFVLPALACLLLASGTALAGSIEIPLQLSAEQCSRHGDPVCVAIGVPEDLADAPCEVQIGDQVVPGQLTPLGLLATPVEVPPGTLPRQVHFILPKLDKGESTVATLRIGASVDTDALRFEWDDPAAGHIDLARDGAPVLRYMCAPLDESSAEAREKTYKVFHHVFAPGGQTRLTKGAGGKYTHHRGLFYGFNRISYEGSGNVDTWHCKGSAYLSHEGVIRQTAGPVLGRHLVKIAWHGGPADVFAEELRETTAYATPEGLMVDFASVLKTKVGKVRLDGDPQHAGYQFRAAQEVADNDQKLTYYLRPDGKGQPGATINWSSKSDDPRTVDQPWKGMSFVVDGTRYTAVRIPHPANPSEERLSERTYGRFGGYFEYELTEAAPLELRYRMFFTQGEMSIDACENLACMYCHPVGTSTKAVPVERSDRQDNVPPEGFSALFNGQDLTGWKGLVGNPETRSKMSDEELARQQEAADQNMRDHWYVENGTLVFDGKEGGRNICTGRPYRDFELLVDWKIGHHGDSGVYLRGSPQVQIWDPADHPEGSGGLYNNKIHPSEPLVCADRPIGQWNTFRIKMVGEKVSVWLNGKCVVDDVVMENYWNRDKPIYREGAIELQNHGHPLYFKNVFVREIDAP